MSSSKEPAEDDFDCTHFPPPPPEAENWVPDPDSIPRPGLRSDFRFRRSPYEAARLRALMNERGYSNHPSPEASSSRLSDLPSKSLSAKITPAPKTTDELAVRSGCATAAQVLIKPTIEQSMEDLAMNSEQPHQPTSCALPDGAVRRWRHYEHYKKVSLVLSMEMKLREEELRQLSDSDLEKHLVQISSLHRQLLVKTGVIE